MLTLLLLRHGKAVPGGTGDDFDRALAPKGKADAAELGAYLARIGSIPDLALVSAANRTRQTFQIVAKGMGRSIMGQRIQAQDRDDLYNATSTQLSAAVSAVTQSAPRLLVVGHNPGIMEAASAMATDGDRIDIERMRSSFPPCALAIVTFPRDEWRDVREGGGRLEAFLLPQDYSATR